MTENILATYDNVKFIEGKTKLTQPNWQSYFGASIPNGVFSGLELRQQDQGVTLNYYVMDGVAFVNGIKAELSTAQGYTDIGQLYIADDKDCFVCLRVYFGSEKAELIRKDHIIDGITEYTSSDYYKYTWALGKFIQDEAYQCERGNNYWDIPLYYRGNAHRR